MNSIEEITDLSILNTENKDYDDQIINADGFNSAGTMTDTSKVLNLVDLK